MYKRKDGRWQQAVKIGGTWRYISGKTQKEVMRKIREAQDHVADGTLFSSVADDFEGWRFGDLAPGSLVVYRPALRAAVDRFGDSQVEDISPRDVQLYLSDLSMRYAAKTVSNYRGILSQVFQYAITQKGLEIANPCASVRVPPSRIPAKTRRPLSDTQRAAIEKTQPGDFLLAFLIVYTGCRLGEACGLRFGDVDYAAQVVHIRRAVHWQGNRPYIGRLKTKNAERDVPLLSPLRDMLQQVSGSSSEYIVSGKDLLTASQLDSRWKEFCISRGLAHPVERRWKTRGVERRHLDWVCDIDRHSIRHDFATSLFRAGLPVKSVQHILGHADYATTMDIYVHWQASSLDAARIQLEEFLRS